jgi:hypothetical protein
VESQLRGSIKSTCGNILRALLLLYTTLDVVSIPRRSPIGPVDFGHSDRPYNRTWATGRRLADHQSRPARASVATYLYHICTFTDSLMNIL